MYSSRKFCTPKFVIYIKNELQDDYRALAAGLPAHEFHEAEGGKQSFTIEFASIDA